MLIYKVINTINNKIYIGKTQRSLNERFGQHLSNFNNPKRKGKSLLYDSMNKYGKENFKIELVEDVSDVNDKKYLNFSESYWIIYYRSNEREFGYNIKSDSGGGDTWTNNPNKEKTSKRLSKASSGKGNGMYKKGYLLKGEKNGKYKKSNYSFWLEKYGKEEADRRQEKWKENLSCAISGKNNWRQGRSNYEFWIDKYGKEEADRRQNLKVKK